MKPIDVETIVRVVTVANANDRRRGAGTGRAEAIQEAQRLVDLLAELRECLHRGALAGEHMLLWAPYEFASDREAVRRLHHAAVLQLDRARGTPLRGVKHALDIAAHLTVKHAHLFAGTPPVDVLREVCARAGIVVTDRRLQQALTRAVKEIKVHEKPPT